jgi:glucosamine--fructose-6-phosphate aminotransferase (isomerizing)
VNRRQSDITHRAHGVFYTSDGRDIEMSVASTKAFYSQIVAGHILALCISQLLGFGNEAIVGELKALEQAPLLMNRVLEKAAMIRASAWDITRRKKYWAVVGSGPNKVAADEIRIKLSELCYKTISSDIVEDKKHIDLSAEPLIIVCAAGSPEAVLGDIIKDVSIFKAHKAGVVVFADEGDPRFEEIADSVISLPAGPMPLPVILNTMAGHLWGYYAACSIDEDSSFFQEFRNVLNLEMVRQNRKAYSLYERLADKNLHLTLDRFYLKFNELRNRGSFSPTSVKTISDISLLVKYASGKLPLEDYWAEFNGDNTANPIELLNVALGHAVDELSRPIDAIRHQAKTVTVGTSRKEEVLKGPFFDILKALRFLERNLKGQNILALNRIQRAISRIKGYTLYDVNDLDEEGVPLDT